jgi:acetyl-CoA carboxylase biotin carboxylase subunit
VCRFYDEDPDRQFLPSPGLVRAMATPSGPGIRDDRGVTAGFEVPVFYDPLIAKLIAWGETRERAIARLRRALGEYRVVGVTTSVPFFQWLVDEPAFLEARFETTYLDRVLAERRGRPFVTPSDADERDAAVAVALAAWNRTQTAESASQDSAGHWRRAARIEATK